MTDRMETFLSPQTCNFCSSPSSVVGGHTWKCANNRRFSRVLTRGMIVLSCLVALVLPATTHAKEGFYLGVGIGGAIVSGDTNIALKGPGVPAKNGNLVTASTDYGAGLAALFRMGYNFFGAAAIEMAFVGHGANLGGDDLEGVGHLNFNVVVHPLGILNLAKVTSVGDMWDPYVLIGGGFSYGSYVATFDDDDKGWFNADLQTGIGLNIHLAPIVSIGTDLRLTVPFGDTWIYDWEDDKEFEPKDSTTSLIFTPMFVCTLHIL